MIKNLHAIGVPSLEPEDPLEKRIATYSSILTWRIPQIEENGRLQFMGLQRVGHFWGTNTWLLERIHLCWTWEKGTSFANRPLLLHRLLFHGVLKKKKKNQMTLLHLEVSLASINKKCWYDSLVEDDKPLTQKALTSRKSHYHWKLLPRNNV